jgi:hypothetical protein
MERLMTPEHASLNEKEEGFRLLQQFAGPTADISLRKTTSEKSPARRFGAPPIPEVIVAPYIVWLDNRSSLNLEVEIAWVQLNVGGVQRTGGVVYAGQAGPFVLGGANGCATVYAYVLVVRYQGNYVGDTGVVQPDSSDGEACGDAYAVG